MIRVNQEVNRIFSPLWEQEARYYILMGGRGAGRSTAASQFILSRLLAPEFFRCAIMRAVSSDIRHSIWRELMDRIHEQNLQNTVSIVGSDMRVEYGGNSVQAHGFKASSGSLTARLKSLANYNTVVIEEAEEVGELEFMTLDDTLRTTKGNIRLVLLLNPPPKNHWIIKRWFDLTPAVEGFYTASLSKSVDNVIFLPGTYKQNIANLDADTVKRYEAYLHTKPAYYHQMIEGLVPETVRGKIYNGWRLIDTVPKEARLMGFGEDYGWYPDPAAVVAIWYCSGEYILDEVAYGTELSNEVLATKIREYGSALTVADSAEPKSIEEQKKWIRVVPSEKGKDSVVWGIKLVAEKRIAVTKRSENIWREYENYAWEEDKDGNPTGDPVHEYSHSMDASRYYLSSISTKKSEVKTFKPVWTSYGHTTKPRPKVNVFIPGRR